MNELNRPYLVLHFCVFLWGFTAILGDLIALSGLVLVWWRVLLTCSSLVFILKQKNITLKGVSKRMTAHLFLIGLFVMLHWVAFYGSIKEGKNPSVTLSCLATTSFFTSLIEPLVTGRAVRWYEILLGIIIVPGMYMIFYFAGDQYFWAIVYGLFSAFFASVFSSMNKSVVDKIEPISMSFIELGGGFLWLSLALLFFPEEHKFLPTASDWFYLTILAFVCTTLPFILSLRALRQVSAFDANLIVNLEPVYGVFLTWVLLHKGRDLDTGFYLGICIVLTTVFAYPLVRKYFEKSI